MNEYKYEDIYIGQKEEFLVNIDEEKENSFRLISGDVNPLHYDDDFAKELMPNVDSHVTFGLLTASYYSTLAGVYLPGKYSLIHSLDIKFKNPVFAGDKLKITGEVIEKQDGLKLIVVKSVIRNQIDKIVSEAKIKILVQK